MGVRFYARIHGTSEDWTDNGSGNALAREFELLDRLVRKQGYKSLMKFYVPHPEEMVGRDKEEWFNPMEGVGIIDGMIRALEEHRDEFAEYGKLREDLDDLRGVLDRAAGLGKRWNLALDA